MEKDRSSKVIAIVALFVAVVGLSIGFASFSRTLEIQPSADVEPINTFSVVFSSTADEVLENAVTPTLTPDPETTDNVVLSATNATISNGLTPTISNLAATFSEPGQKVEYTFYVHPSEFDAYLRAVTFNNVTGDTVAKKCVAKDAQDTTVSTVNAACESISLKVELTDSNDRTTSYDATDSEVSGHKLAKDSFKPVKVTIEYAADGAKADGDFTVSFGSVSLLYKTVDKTTGN